MKMSRRPDVLACFLAAGTTLLAQAPAQPATARARKNIEKYDRPTVPTPSCRYVI